MCQPTPGGPLKTHRSEEAAVDLFTEKKDKGAQVLFLWWGIGAGGRGGSFQENTDTHS